MGTTNRLTQAVKLYHQRQRTKGLCRACPEKLSPESTQFCPRHVAQRRHRHRVKKLHTRWLAWRAKHLKRCEDFPGPCCQGCHDIDELQFDDLENGNMTYLCCEKRASAGVVMVQALYQASLKHAVSYKTKPDLNQITKLPQGLLRTYLESCQ